MLNSDALKNEEEDEGEELGIYSDGEERWRGVQKRTTCLHCIALHCFELTKSLISPYHLLSSILFLFSFSFRSVRVMNPSFQSKVVAVNGGE